MTPFIQNVSLEEIKVGQHFDCGPRAVLIQIMCPDSSFPRPKHQFQAVHQFEFFDCDREDINGSITEIQAQSLVEILQNAIKNKQNIVVHCHAGICRSGAVVEVGVMMGFGDTEKMRLPNSLVKRRMMKVLGWTYDEVAENAKFQELWHKDSILYF